MLPDVVAAGRSRLAANSVYDAVAGYGPLQRHLLDPTVEICSPGSRRRSKENTRASGQRTDLRALADTASASLRSPAGSIGFRSTGKSGERAVRTQLGLSKSTRLCASNTPPRRFRVHDGTEFLPNSPLRNHEVKTGRTDRPDDLVQCDKDGLLERFSSNNISDIVWHFVGNSRYNTMGPSRELLDCLTRESLGIALHVPA